MKYSKSMLLALLLLNSCDKTDASVGDANSKMLAERLMAAHGEGVLAQPVLVVFDSGWVVGRGSDDPEFSSKAEKLGVSPAASLGAGAAPVAVQEYYSQQGVEFAISSASQKVVVVDATSSLNIRLLLGQPGIKALRSCERVRLERVCTADGELRAWLDETVATGGDLIDGSGMTTAEGKVKGNWLIFPDSRDVDDDAVIELQLADGVRCNLSKWLLDPRDSCQI